MASTLTLQLDLKNWPDPPTLGCLTTIDGRTDTVALMALHEPLSTAGMAQIMRTLTRLWVEPELSDDPGAALDAYLESIGTRLL